MSRITSDRRLVTDLNKRWIPHGRIWGTGRRRWRFERRSPRWFSRCWISEVGFFRFPLPFTLVYAGNISTSMYSPHICFLSLYILCICIPFHVVVVLIPYTRPPYGTEAHPVGKCYAINIEAEKTAFEQRSKHRQNGHKNPLPPL